MTQADGRWQRAARLCVRALRVQYVFVRCCTALTVELGGGAVHGDLHLALAPRLLDGLADQHQALLVGLVSGSWGTNGCEGACQEGDTTGGRGGTGWVACLWSAPGPPRWTEKNERTCQAAAKNETSNAKHRKPQPACAGSTCRTAPAARTWMQGAKPPSSPTFTASTPYLRYQGIGNNARVRACKAPGGVCVCVCVCVCVAGFPAAEACATQASPRAPLAALAHAATAPGGRQTQTEHPREAAPEAAPAPPPPLTSS